MRPNYKKLNPQQERFVDEYLIDLNGTRAYRAVYPDSTYGNARSEASRLLAKPNIRAEIRAARADQQRRTLITADRVLKELARVAFSDILDLFDENGLILNVSEIPLNARRAIASMKVRRVRTPRQAPNAGAGDSPTDTRITEEIVEIRFVDKLGALDKLLKHFGLLKDPTPLEELLNLLPANLAAEVRTLLAS